MNHCALIYPLYQHHQLTDIDFALPYIHTTSWRFHVLLVLTELSGSIQCYSRWKLIKNQAIYRKFHLTLVYFQNTTIWLPGFLLNCQMFFEIGYILAENQPSNSKNDLWNSETNGSPNSSSDFYDPERRHMEIALSPCAVCWLWYHSRTLFHFTQL